LGALLVSYRKLRLNPKTIPEFNNVLQLIWSVLPELAIDNAAKHFRKRLQACVSASGGYLGHKM